MKFRAYRIFNEENKVASRFVDLTLNELDPGEVVIRAAYSSVNYKDALAATGAGKIIRRFPCVGGIDVAGVVVSSHDARFAEGDKVIVTGYELGVAHDGGYAELVRVPASWVVRLPPGLSLHDAMALGTAGFTAALSLYRLQQNDVTPESGKVVITGATGGVASLAISMLKRLKYHVVAITGKDSEHEYLKSLGADEILPRSAIDLTGTRPLERMQWAAALDSVGGATLAWLTRTMQQNGVIASFGNAGGVELNTSVLPFILRGVRLIGIDSAATAMPLRQEIWHRLANEWRPQQLDRLVHTVEFEQLPEIFSKLLNGEAHGRTVIKITG
ncbi:MAG: oxidoreductase [Gallionellales bacterium 35-53-114]|jgi:NADPH2:quinone reductase|nr:MAG: oxidoreductase [Gallionellales bacterium 35-53-114]OYZ62191.1 MAG: oxidoreductase [Gallionellales bacterium 24-53-125]OZB07250.1 MAG: oxidoreductase [Gallionellales bacterium 39-52-133]HQS59792.1 YhdH/YhfP family quinone oxidoreductase [Gallionellaceae bacterium]HQS76546.1 YhdH/YhfP family quinone oxidoreductase [Gallionellaceae bacterium]